MPRSAVQHKPAVIVVAGATASGKSGLAMTLAQQYNGHIINADSLQQYNALPILTAQPSAADQASIPHHLYGTLAADTPTSAANWQQRAATIIEDCLAAGHLPIVTGGTGLYIKALLAGLSPMPDIPENITDAVKNMVNHQGLPALVAYLQQHDPVLAQRLKPNDRQRLMRGTAVHLHSGIPLSTWQAMPPTPPAWHCIRILCAPPRPILHQQIEQRFAAMLEMGALAEVEVFLKTPPQADAAIWHALGLNALQGYLEGRHDLATATRLTIIQTRQYAKRQTTWFRHQFQADIPCDDMQQTCHIHAYIRMHICSHH